MRHLWIAFISSLITQVAAAAPSLSHQSLAFQSDAAGTIEMAFRFQVARDVPVIGFPGPQELFLPAPTLASALNGPLVLDIRSNTLSALVVNEGRRVLATGSQFSANGRYQLVVALGPVHPNGSGERDGTYLVDRQTGAYWLVNHLPGQPEVIADGFITAEHVSDDGEVVYFSYEGIDLAPTQVDHMQRLVYGFERASGTIRLINPAPLGTATDQAFSVFWVSANGREVIYRGGESLFHYDWQTNQSRAITGMPLGSGGRLIGRSGQFLFSCATVRRPGATQTDSIWTRRDLLTGDALVLNPVSNAAASTDTCLSVGEASDDGSVFAFSSAMPPISGIPDPSNWQTYRWSAATGQTELISHAFGQSDAFALGASIHSDLSADGRTLLFRSTAQNLVPGITGRRVNALYRYDAQRQSMQLVSATQSAPTVPLESGVAALLSDGSAVFASRAELDETVRDWNLSGDLFRRTETGTATLLSRTIVTAPISASRGVARHALSADGRWLAMQSTARSLVPGGLDLNQQPDVLLVDTWTGQRRVISNSADRLAQTARGTSELITISADGQTV